MAPAVVNIRGLAARARKAQAENDVEAIYRAAMVFRSRKGRFADSVFEIACADAPPGSFCDPPTDPWGQDYLYKIEGEYPVVMSLGADQAIGGDGEDSDVVYSVLDEK